MNDVSKGPVHAYHNEGFLGSRDARALRILSEYLEPNSRFQYHHVDDTIVFMVFGAHIGAGRGRGAPGAFRSR